MALRHASHPPFPRSLSLHPLPLFLLSSFLLLASCSPNQSNFPQNYPTYNPFIPLQGSALTANSLGTALPSPSRTPGPTPTFAPLSVTLLVHNPDAPLVTPTPNMPRTLPTPRQGANQYVVQSGDTLNSIAQNYGVSVETLMRANNLSSDVLSIGQTLNVPAPTPGALGSAFKIIPDSELVYGPAAALFDVAAFIQNQNGYLANYSEDVNNEPLTGAQVVERISRDYSVNPRLLLALLEYRSGWVTTAKPAGNLDYPLGFVDTNHAGLYRQLEWAANELNRGFYLWQADAVGTWVLGDGSIVPVDPTINAGTAGAQNALAILDNRKTWDTDVGPLGLFKVYFLLFGDPFNLAIEPLAPAHLSQPRMSLPFEHGATWAFTGGPHASWDSGSAWGALDFAPADIQGCAVSGQWVTAVADGFIVRASNGAVIEDLDGDGYEQTGWDVLYMHMAAQDRVPAGTYVYRGDHIGHPSCEGGVANAAHLHLTRKYNGEWIAADGSLPFVLSGWVSSGTGSEYDGLLKRGSATLEAAEGISDQNQITP